MLKHQNPQSLYGKLSFLVRGLDALDPGASGMRRNCDGHESGVSRKQCSQEVLPTVHATEDFVVAFSVLAEMTRFD